MRKILKKLILHAALFVMPFQLSASNDDDPCGPCKEWDSASKTCVNVPDNKDCCGGLPIPKGFECCNGNLCNECQYCDEMQGICINHPFGALCDEGVCCGGECIDTNEKDCCHEKPIPLGQACCETDDDCSDCEECKDNYCQKVERKEADCVQDLTLIKVLSEHELRVCHCNDKLVTKVTTRCVLDNGGYGIGLYREESSSANGGKLQIIEIRRPWKKVSGHKCDYCPADEVTIEQVIKCEGPCILDRQIFIRCIQGKPRDSKT